MIIGIGGVSRAGKTTLAFRIRNWIGQEKVKILHQDEYIKSLDQMPKINGHIDWEHPESLDFIRLKEDMEQACKDFEVLIVEGLMVFWNRKLTDLLQKKIYLTIDKEAFLERKTIDKRWEDEPEWYIEHIWESHFKYGKLPPHSKDVLQLDGESGLGKKIIMNFLNI